MYTSVNSSFWQRKKTNAPMRAWKCNFQPYKEFVTDRPTNSYTSNDIVTHNGHTLQSVKTGCLYWKHRNFWVFHSRNNIDLYPIRKTQFWIRIPAISEWCLSPVKLQHRGDLGNPIFPTEIPFFRFYPPLPAFLMSSLVIKFSDRKNWSIT